MAKKKKEVTVHGHKRRGHYRKKPNGGKTYVQPHHVRTYTKMCEIITRRDVDRSGNVYYWDGWSN